MNPSASQAYAMRLATAFMPCETMRTEVEAIGHLNSPERSRRNVFDVRTRHD
jgi:hypothetical protein